MVPLVTDTVLAVCAAVPGAQVVAAVTATVVTPAGNVSVNAAPVIGTEFGLVSVMVSIEVPPTPIVAGVNVFATVGGKIVTVNVALAGAAFDPALVVVTAPAVMVFV